ncbi:MAG: (Fe-S)-binding protein [Nitrospirota bacterium]
MKYPILHDYENEISRCIKCGACRAVCPTFKESLDESMVARGRISLTKAVIENRLDLTEGFDIRISTCINCKACAANCPTSVKVDDIMLSAKAQIAKNRGVGLIENLISKQVVKRGWPMAYILKTIGMMSKAVYEPLEATGILGNFLLFVADKKKRLVPDLTKSPFLSRYPEIITCERPKGRVAFFVGCAINFMDQRIGDAVIKVLKKNNIEIILPKDQLCCGRPLLSLGDRDTALYLARKNAEIFNKLKVDAIVTACATCGLTIKDEYNKIHADKSVSDFSARLIDINEFIVNNTDFEKGLRPLEKKVTYHDPCHLKRGQGIDKSPREILEAVFDNGFVEMKEADTCCGFGGLFSFYHYNLSARIADKKAKNISDTKADIVASACPGCLMHIKDALNRNEINIDAKHTIELLAESY